MFLKANEKLRTQLSRKEQEFLNLKSSQDQQALSERQLLSQQVIELEKSNETLKQSLNEAVQEKDLLNAKLKAHEQKLQETASQQAQELEKVSQECEQLKAHLLEAELNWKKELADTEAAHKLKHSDEVAQMNLQNAAVENKLKQLLSEHALLRQKAEQQAKSCLELSDKLEAGKQSWSQERALLIAKKEDEFQKHMQQLEKRFEEDYSTFMQTHKEAIQRTLNEKSGEHAKEKDKLVEVYEKRLAEQEALTSGLKRQLKEATEAANQQRHKRTTDVQVQTLMGTGCANNCEERTSGLLDKIRSLEELIGSADAHFEQEVERLRQELDDDYQLKLKYELEREEINRQQLECIIENLKHKLDYSGDISGLEAAEKSAKLKEEELERHYRAQLNDEKDKFDARATQIQHDYEAELSRVRQDLQAFKLSVNKSKGELERMQTVVHKLKKTNMDSDRVIESLKLEMNKMKESHLDELTQLKMNAEREKEAVKEKLEQALKRADSLQAQADEYSVKMKDVMKSHAAAVELLKKQQHQNVKLTAMQQINKTCQTDTSSKDIELLETFRQKYLVTLARMKSNLF